LKSTTNTWVWLIPIRGKYAFMTKEVVHSMLSKTELLISKPPGLWLPLKTAMMMGQGQWLDRERILIIKM
jgi:hypothetical protein